MFLQGQVSLPLLIYNIFTWSNQSPFIDLQYFYRVKSVSISSIYEVFTGSNQFPFFFLQGFHRVKTVSLYRFTRILQVQTSLPFLIYNVFTGSNQSPFFDFQGFYRAQSMSWFTWCLHVIYILKNLKKIYGLFTKKILLICVKHFTRFYMVSYLLPPKDAGCNCFLQ